MIRGTTIASPARPAARCLLRPAASFIVLCVVITDCSHPNAAQMPEHARAPAHEEGEVRIQDASRQFIEVEKVRSLSSSVAARMSG